MLINLLRKVLFLLFVFILIPIYALNPYSIQNESAGAGLVSTNLDDDPRPDLISAHVNMKDGNDIIYYRVAKNIDKDAHANWSDEKSTSINFGMAHLQGLGITIGDIDGNDKKDMLFVVMDNPNGENRIRYKIGWDINSQGDIAHNNISPIIIVDDNNFDIGETTDGLGASLWDIDKNGKLDMIIVWSDSKNQNNCNSFGHHMDDGVLTRNTGNGYCHYTIPNGLYGIVLWNLDKDGKHEKISDKFEIDGSGHYWVMSGLGIELANLDTNPAPDLIYSFIDERFNKDNYSNPHQRNKIFYTIGWNIQAKEDGKNIQFQRFDNIKELPDNGNKYNAGMGVAVAQMDGNHAQDLIYSTIDAPYSGIDTVNLYTEKNFNKGKAILGEEFSKILTPNRTELITHQGRVISLSLDNGNKTFTYSVMKDDETWAEIQKLHFPDLPVDSSVRDVVKNSPFAYEYENREIHTKTFHLYSDNDHLYLFRSDGKYIYVDRFILDTVDHKLLAPYDTRYRRSEQKCYSLDENNKMDTIGYESMDGVPFSEPTVVIWYPKNNNISIKDFSVELISTIIPKEARWQFFILDDDNYAGLHAISFRQAQKDTCNEDAHRVYLQGFFSDEDKDIKYTEEDETEGTKTLHGIIRSKSYSAAELGYDNGDYFVHGPNTVSYANQQICEDKLIKREQRIKLIIPKRVDGKNPMLEIDYGINSFGEISDINKDIKGSFEDQDCEEAANTEPYKAVLSSVADGVPFIYDSADGFLHLLHKANGHQSSMIYDPHKDEWRDKSSSDNEQIKGGWGVWNSSNGMDRIPWFSYPTPLDHGGNSGYSATAAEYGSYTYDTDENIKGILKRAYAFVKPNDNGERKVNIITEELSEIDIKYINQAKIDSTIVGYIEGAPPVPSENLTNKNTDYNGITSVEMLMADSTAQSYIKSRDTGMNFFTDGTGGGIAWKIDTSYSWLSEETVGQESTDSLQMKQKLKGSWSEEEGLWIPHNIGMVAVRAKKADVYGLYLKDNDALFAYRIVPILGSEEDMLTPFVINDEYIKNGSLKGEDGKSSYAKDDELKKIKEDIQRAEDKIKAYFDRSTYRSAFENIDAKNKYDVFNKRNIINAYEWSAAGGSRSRSMSYMSQISDTLGGSFNFLGIGGFGAEVSIGIGAESTTKARVMFGGHIKRTFKETEESTHSFELSVKADIDSDGVMDDQLNAIDAGKVDYYKWETAYLEPSTDNFNDFFSRVVDRKWLQGDNRYAKELRDARNHPNEAWRIRHFVTFASHAYENNSTQVEGK